MSTVKNGNKTYYIHVVIMFALTFLVPYLPPFGQITDAGMDVLGVFLGLLYGWIFIDIFWTSLFGYVALALTGQIGFMGAITQSFSNYSLLLTIFLAVFAQSVTEINVTTFVSHWLLSKKIFIGRPWLLIIAMLSIVLVLALLGPGMAALFLMWTIVLSIAEVSGYGKQHIVISMLISFLVFVMMCGSNSVTFHGNPVLYNGFFQPYTGAPLQTIPWLVLGLLYTFICFALMILFCKFILKVDVSHFSPTPEMCEEFAKTKATKVQKVGLILLVVYFFALIFAELFTQVPLFKTIKSLGPVGLGVIYMLVFIIWRDENGKSYVNLLSCFNKGIPWSVVILFGVTLPLVSLMQSPDVGIMATINAFIAPLLSGMSVTKLFIISGIALAIITQFSHNLVLVAMFTPILIPAATSLGGNPFTMAWIIFISLNCAFATPAGSAFAGYVYGHPNVRSKDGYILGCLFLAVSTITMIAMIPLCNLLF